MRENEGVRKFEKGSFLLFFKFGEKETPSEKKWKSFNLFLGKDNIQLMFYSIVSLMQRII